ncbi:hypothetical protein ACHAQH_002257 [Verticillium albo-atrum]
MDNSGAHDLQRRAQSDMRASLIAYIVILCSICVIFVSLRFYIRIHVIRNFGKDDWAVAATMLVWFSGLGYHVTIIVLKCAFLLQYRRAFPLPVFQQLCDIFLAFIACWSLVGLIAPLAICLPIPSQWEPENLGSDNFCYGRWQVWLAHGIIHVITDVLIFAMPLPLIKTLPLTKPQKLTLTGVFCLGFITCVISAVRISTLHDGLFDSDASWVMARTIFWSLGEITCAILCLCIPVLRPLLGGRARANLRRWRSGGQADIAGIQNQPHLTIDSSQAWTAPAPSSRTTSRGSIRSVGDIEMRETTWESQNQVTSHKLDPPSMGVEWGVGSTWKSDVPYRGAI